MVDFVEIMVDLGEDFVILRRLVFRGMYGLGGQAREILSQAGISDSGRSRPFFEILVETKVLAGAPSQPRVVAWRK